MNFIKYVLCAPNDDNDTMTVTGSGGFGDTTHGGADNGRDGSSSSINRSEKMNDAEFNAVYAKLLENESKVPYMYLDSNGNVTVGVGIKLPSVAAAQKMGFLKTDGKRATAAEIKAEFDRVKSVGKGKIASAYKSSGSLTLSEAEIKSSFRAYVDNDRKSLRDRYPSFYDFSLKIQVALHDMIYQLGVAGLGKFTNFNTAVNKKDWAKAAIESKRPDANAARNKFVSDTFNEARAIQFAAEQRAEEEARRSEH
ncbi:hypothetical protein [Serratia sp. ASV30]|uniref:hypothetical protein n=1 Tax=Serratia sp. ASV30 TaxID=2795127 RepID=UPI0018EBACB0|nr:hypothetical protein [Serratia sp. ASV30]